MIKAGVILLNKNFTEVLMVRGRKYINPFTGFEFQHGIYSFPKGHAADNEEFHKCAERELVEETNIKIKILPTDMRIKLADGVYFIKFIDKNDVKFKNIRRWEISKIQWKKISELKRVIGICNRAVKEFLMHLKEISKLIDF